MRLYLGWDGLLSLVKAVKILHNPWYLNPTARMTPRLGEIQMDRISRTIWPGICYGPSWFWGNCSESISCGLYRSSRENDEKEGKE